MDRITVVFIFLTLVAVLGIGKFITNSLTCFFAFYFTLNDLTAIGKHSKQTRHNGRLKVFSRSKLTTNAKLSVNFSSQTLNKIVR